MRDDKTKWIFEDEGAPERRPAGGTPYAETIRSAADATSAAPTDLAARTTRLVASREETVIYQADAGFAVNRHWIGTPDRHPKGTPV